MSILDETTVLILTYNEEANIRRTLSNLQWARRIVVVDSFSTDETINILHMDSRVEVHQRRFDSHANQWNYGLDRIQSEWVLALDADYQITEYFVEELRSLSPPQTVDGYYARFKYMVNGRVLRATLYPPRAVLFKCSRCRYEQNGHTQVLQIPGPTGWLNSPIHHDDRKPLSDWLRAQDKYTLLEAHYLTRYPADKLNFADRLRNWIIPAPVIVFLYTLFIRGLILDGWRGWYYVSQRTLAEILLSLRLLEIRLEQ